MDFFISNKTTLGFVTSGFISPESYDGKNTSYLKNGSNRVDSIVNSYGNNRDRWKNGSLNLNFRHQFDSAGRELTADVDYVTYTSNNNQHFINNSFTPDWTKKIRQSSKGFYLYILIYFLLKRIMLISSNMILNWMPV